MFKFEFDRPKNIETKFHHLNRRENINFYGMVDVPMKGKSDKVKTYMLHYPTLIRSEAVAYFHKQAKAMNGTLKIVNVLK